MRELTQEAVVTTVMQYVEAWNEPDAVIRLIMFERCWADDATYVDPNVELSGRAALCAHVSKVQSGRPGAWIEMRPLAMLLISIGMVNAETRDGPFVISAVC